MTDYEWFSLRICLFFLPDTAAIHCGAILDNKNEKKEACSCPEGIRSPASQRNPNDRGMIMVMVTSMRGGMRMRSPPRARLLATMMERPLTLSLSKMWTKLIWSAFARIVTRE